MSPGWFKVVCVSVQMPRVIQVCNTNYWFVICILCWDNLLVLVRQCDSVSVFLSDKGLRGRNVLCPFLLHILLILLIILAL